MKSDFSVSHEQVTHAKHSVKIPLKRNVEQTLGPRSGPAAYARAVRRYNITTEFLIGDKGKVLRRGRHHHAHKPTSTNGDAAGSGGDGEETSEVPAESCVMIRRVFQISMLTISAASRTTLSM